MTAPDISPDAVEHPWVTLALNTATREQLADGVRILRGIVEKQRAALTASGEQISAIKELKSYQAGQISTYSDVYLAADVRAILAKGETK